ncbi:glycosyltransferase family 2 protein [Microbacter margulisiae]|uniref:Glycosyltransferase 2-like domain-containing protein n=1 Tax=Microbacter margulisiae TaxID=1350067 RepID=A0A7W5DQY7_9PORP|nr:glycosyltransferase family 2 protein [Microbacter margulisiae]MBB3187465.1 hypothetical protein [Microbacter margulisiae]
MATIDAFIPYESLEQVQSTLNEMKSSPVIRQIHFITTDHSTEITSIEGHPAITTSRTTATATMKQIANAAQADYILLYLKYLPLQLGYLGLERMLRIAEDTQAGMLYADAYQWEANQKKAHPLIDYQQGSLRDDFDFGSLLLFRTQAFKAAVEQMHETFEYAGLYDLRLKISQTNSLEHINEYLYSEIESDKRASGEKLFDYVDPKNRIVQLEMEQACTNHLKAVNAYLPAEFEKIQFDEASFPAEASVIIPVYNRVKTIEDAIRSVFNQKTDFRFNLIIIDNHSTDGTTEVIKRYASDSRLIHLIPNRFDLGIGGCWNMGIDHPQCGKFAVQLDSDDVYSSENTLQAIVNAFYEQKCGMVVGSYCITNFAMQTIPPGIIDHKEWTEENGRNNALRINGFGAPRAFYTSLLRQLHVPNTSYGEDYALGLAVSRKYRIGRIYDVLYLCRRWEDNSDAALDVQKMNQHNLYKDRIRTWELKARQQMNL